MASRRKTAIRLPRKYAKDEVIEVKTRIIHPNHNGRMAYKDQGYIAEYYVWKIEIFYGDEPIITVSTSSALSQNPYFTFKIKATRSAPLRVVWADTQGDQYTDSVDVVV